MQLQQFKVQNNAAQCNAERLQCNTCSRLKTSVNSVHLGPRRTLIREVLKLRVSKVARVPGTAGSAKEKCVFCRRKRLLQEGVSSAGEEFEGERICVSSAGEIRLQGCGHQAPQCRELAGDASRTCCCPEKVWIEILLVFGKERVDDPESTKIMELLVLRGFWDHFSDTFKE